MEIVDCKALRGMNRVMLNINSFFGRRTEMLLLNAVNLIDIKSNRY